MKTQERLWAPWRRAFILQRRRRGCVFCQARRSRHDRQFHVLMRGRRVFCMLNRYPYNPGHVMVAVNRHVAELGRLTPAESAELMQAAARMTRVLTRALRAHGFNVGLNLGRVAGAGIPGHLHLHIVPRWLGDANFMPATSGTKIMSSSLAVLYTELRRALARPSHS